MSDFIVINAYTNYVEAHIARGVLEEEGIESWLKDENTVTIDPILTNAIGGIKLMVESSQAQRAVDILLRLRNEAKAKVTCPKCGSHNTEEVSTPRKASNWLTALSTFFLSSFSVAPDKVNHCFDCGCEFEIGKEE
jgi:Putative prokaryotic signal transducing protein